MKALIFVLILQSTGAGALFITIPGFTSLADCQEAAIKARKVLSAYGVCVGPISPPSVPSKP